MEKDIAIAKKEKTEQLEEKARLVINMLAESGTPLQDGREILSRANVLLNRQERILTITKMDSFN